MHILIKERPLNPHTYNIYNIIYSRHHLRIRPEGGRAIKEVHEMLQKQETREKKGEEY